MKSLTKLQFAGIATGLIATALILLKMFTFVVFENEEVMLKRFGKVEKNDAEEVVIYKKGIHTKMPFFDNVVRTDIRVLTFEIDNARFMTNEKKDIVIDSIVTYRVVEPLKFITSTSGGNHGIAQQRIERLFVDAIKTEIGKYQILEVSSGAVVSKEIAESVNKKKIVQQITGKRDYITQTITDSVNQEIEESFGIKIVDFRFNSLSLPNEIQSSIFRRMSTERVTVAQRFRAEGKKFATEIRSAADFESNKIIETSKQEGLAIRGEALADVNKIYIDTYSKNIELYKFIKAMESYSTSLNSKDNVILLSTDMPYFKKLFDSNSLGR